MSKASTLSRLHNFHMNWFEKLLPYGLISLGAFFSVVAVYTYFDEGLFLFYYEALAILIGSSLLSGTAFVASGRLLWSHRHRRNRSHELALEAEAEQTHLREVFYQLVTDKQGAFTLMQFAIASGTSPEIAQDFLNHHATTFNANFTVNEEGTVVYQFPVS